MGFGTDFSGVDEIDANWAFLEGEANEVTAFVQAIARRYLTPRGGLFYDQSYGFDIRTLVGDNIEPSLAEAMIATEALGDERVADCQASVTASGPLNGQTWQIKIVVTAKTGATYALTLAVSAVTVELLKAGPV